jgi:hypothetical protein
MLGFHRPEQVELAWHQRNLALETQRLRVKSLGNAVDRFHDEPEYRLPVPARYVTDEGAIIRAAEVNSDYTIQPETSETAKVLRHSNRDARGC